MAFVLRKMVEFMEIEQEGGEFVDEDDKIGSDTHLETMNGVSSTESKSSQKAESEFPFKPLTV